MGADQRRSALDGESSRRSLLVLAPIAPAPTGNGLAMRVWSFVVAAAANHDVQVVVVPVAGMTTAAAELPASVRMVTLDDRDPTVEQVLARLPNAPQAVLACRLRMVPLGRAVAIALRTPLLVDLDEDESELHRELGDIEAAQHARDLAAAQLPHAVLVTVASGADVNAVRSRYGLGATVVHAPNSIRLPRHADHPAPCRGRVVFVGNLTYWPNVEGAQWLTSEVLGRLDEACYVDLVGPANEVTQGLAGPRVCVHGTVDSVDRYYAQADVVAIPLHHGGGTRIKALEAFAHRRPVVSTSKGVEGLDVVDGVHVLIADEPAAFAAAIDRARQPEVAAGLAASGLRYVVEHHESRTVISMIAGLIAQASVPITSAVVDDAEMTQHESRPRAVSGLEVNDAGDGLVIYDSRSGRVHHLNGSAASVFLLCTGELELTAIASEIAGAFALENPPLDEVAACVADLRANDLVA